VYVTLHYTTLLLAKPCYTMLFDFSNWLYLILQRIAFAWIKQSKNPALSDFHQIEYWLDTVMEIKCTMLTQLEHAQILVTKAISQKFLLLELFLFQALWCEFLDFSFYSALIMWKRQQTLALWSGHSF